MLKISKPQKTSPRIDRMAPQRLEVAVFGLGCFLDSEPVFGIVRGVWRTVVGYSGGKYPTPTHGDAGDQIEAVMVSYDPHVLTYGQLLEFFLLRRDVLCQLCQPHAPQHVPCIFTQSEHERRLARAALERHRLYSGGDCQTLVSVYKGFREAEQRFQKHLLRSAASLMSEIGPLYPDEDSLVRSTLAARLNGILGQRTPPEYLPEDIEFYDLSENALHILKDLTRGIAPGPGSPAGV